MLPNILYSNSLPSANSLTGSGQILLNRSGQSPEGYHTVVPGMSCFPALRSAIYIHYNSYTRLYTPTHVNMTNGHASQHCIYGMEKYGCLCNYCKNWDISSKRLARGLGFSLISWELKFGSTGENNSLKCMERKPEAHGEDRDEKQRHVWHMCLVVCKSQFFEHLLYYLTALDRVQKSES